MAWNANANVKRIERELFKELKHSHKKLKDSQETGAERVDLRAYLEKQAILEPILLYRT